MNFNLGCCSTSFNIADGFLTFRKARDGRTLPNPKRISNLMHTTLAARRGRGKPPDSIATVMLIIFSQMVAHDISGTAPRFFTNL